MTRVPTRDRVLDAAATVFAARGFEGATTREIAAAAGINIATLHYHHSDKQTLYDAVVARVYERLLELPGLELNPNASLDRERRLRGFVAVLFGFVCAHREEIRVLLRHVLDTHRLPAAVSERWIHEVIPRVQRICVALEVDLAAHRLDLLSLNHLFARYAITDDADLLQIGVDRATLEQHLGDVAVQLLR